MGQLTNLYVSSSYQGLLKMTDSTNGLTNTLQTVQTGDGDDSPLQMSLTEVNISGSLTVNGNSVLTNTGSLVTTSSFNTYTSSVNTKLAGLDVETGSLQSQINSKLNTSSFNSYTSSNDSKVNSLISQTGSYVTETESGSFLITGSVAGDTLTFTKGNGSQFSLQVNTGSLPAGVVSGSAQIAAFGYATTSSVTSLSSSIATTDLNQNNVIAGLATTSSLTSLSSSIATTDLNQNNVIAGLATTSSLTSLSSSIASTDLSQNNRLTALEGVTGSINRNGLITTGSIGGNQSITGSVNVQGTISATSASFTYVTTVFETASVIYSSGSNQFGDASNDTQTLWGTVVIPSGPVSVTGSVIATNFTGSLQGTASYATNALSASYAPTVLPSGLVSGSSQISYTGITDVPSGIVSGSQQITDLGFATTSSVNQKLDTGSFNSYTSSNDSKVNALIAATGSYVTETESGSFMTTGSISGNVLTFTKGDGSTFGLTIDTGSNSNRNGLITTGSAVGTQSITGSVILSGSAGPELNVIGDVIITGSIIMSGSAGVELDVKGDQTNTGSLNISGSVNVVGPVGLNLLQPNPFKQNLTLLGGVNHFTSSTVLNNYLNAITTSLSNNDNNFVLAPGGGLTSPAGIGASTGSVFISGSNNLILNLGSTLPAAQGRRQIYGIGNIGITAPNINTSSLTIPVINNNYSAGTLALTLTTGSNQGNNAHQFSGNVNLGSITWNHPSASIASGIVASNVGNNVNVGAITSITIGPTLLTSSATVQNNIISNPSTNLNHISSSIQFNQNIVGGNTITFNNRYYQTGSNNFLAVSANIFGGQQLVVNAAGAPLTNVSRTLVGNIIGGQSVNVSLEQNNLDTAGLRNSIVYGQGLNVTGSHSAASTAQNSITLVGRWNGQDNGLADSARTVFAVGTGTSDGTRRTSLHVTSGSLVGISGSLVVNGDTTMSSSTTFPLTVDGTINSKRLHFTSNPFNSNPSSNLGAIRFEGTNQTFYSTNYDLAEITTQSMVFQTVVTGSGLVQTGLRSNNRGSDYNLILTNQSGTGSLITNANTIVSGSLTIANNNDLFVYGNKQFNGAQYSSLQTLSGSANVSQSVYFDTTGPQFGVSLVDNTKLTVANSGTYNIQFSAQLLADTGADNTFIWFKKNGTNIAGSASQILLENNQENLVTVNILDTANANDYYEIAWESDNGDAVLLYEPASGNVPSIPSVITTVTQVR